MRIIFDVSDLIDDAGIATYKAMLPSSFDVNGIPIPGACVGYGETVWEAVSMLVDQLEKAGVDAYVEAYAGEAD